MPVTAETSAPAAALLWDVIEEHLDEAAYGVEQFERALEHPSSGLAALERHPEALLLAHLDALVVAGGAAQTELLVPALEAADGEQPERVVAAALALIQAGRHELLWPALAHELPGVRRAAVRAAALGGNPVLERWLLARLQAGAAGQARASLLELVAARRLAPPSVIAELQSDDVELIIAAAHAAAWGEAQLYLPVMEYLREHADAGVRAAALIATLRWGSSHAFNHCERLALDAKAPDPLALALYAALGGRAQHTRLVKQLEQTSERKPVLFALGFSGDCALVPVLLAQLEREDPLEQKLAAQAIATILGIDLLDETFAAEPSTPSGPSTAAQAELPPLEQDDLDADLVPQPEDALPLPNARAIAAYFQTNAEHFDAGRPYLMGVPLGLHGWLDALERAPLRRRHLLALALSIRSAGAATIDTRAFSRDQRAQLERVRAQDTQLRAVTRW